MRDDDIVLQYRAARTLWTIRAGFRTVFDKSELALYLAMPGNPSGYVKKQLLETLKDEEEDIRLDACRTLRVLFPKEQEAIGVLVLISRDSKDVSRRLNAFEEIERFGNVAKEAIPALEKLLSDKEQKVRNAATKALESIRSTATGKK